MDEHQPDILIGCESHFDGNYSSFEVFPPGYTYSAGKTDHVVVAVYFMHK